MCSLCGVGCRLEPGDPPRARGVAGPANPNGRLCQKGVRAFESPENRLERPLVRRGGELTPVSWATAYDRVVESFREILASGGPDALAFLGAPHSTNEENYLLQKLARILGTNNVDNRSRLCHVSTARALSERVGWPATTNSLSSLPDADVIVVAGANPAERQPIAFNSFIRPAVNDGTTLVHVDPAGNRTTRLADIHVKPRPGTDALLFDLLSARIHADERGVDRTFVDERTSGYEGFAASLGDIASDETLLAAGVEETSVERVADLIADANRVAGLVGTGIEGSPGDANASAALLNLLLLTGNVGRSGTGLYILRGLANEQGATDAGCVPDKLPGHQPVTDSAARARVAAEWGTTPPSDPGTHAKDMLTSFGDGIRGALAVGENPAISKRDPDWVRQQLDALDTLVVVDVMSNETTQHADVVLPAMTGAEKEGTVTNLERRVQRLQQVQTPPERARSDFEILSDIGARVTDRPDEFDYASVADVFDELSRVAPTHVGMSYDEIGREGSQWPVDCGDVLYRDEFETADSRARFGSAQPLISPGSDDGFWLVTGGRMSEFHDDASSGDPTLRINPTDARELGVDPGATVDVSSDGTAVRTRVQLDDGIRCGAVYLPANVADPLLRHGATTVSVALPSAERDRPERRNGDESAGAERCGK
ncbi:molybdopterin oxidoreductase family protein [Halorubrum halophilum]|uniref:molybdopterin oxidoreductase family protein n=1 Tax=Halorubrum halophilum TaxID=413816 RepID=UPI001F174C61|nr:molybdopterin-dependent oxidoreductase [Halorubrum halophilum]